MNLNQRFITFRIFQYPNFPAESMTCYFMEGLDTILFKLLIRQLSRLQWISKWTVPSDSKQMLMTVRSVCLCSEGLLEMSYFENLFLNYEVVKGADAVFYYSYSSEVVQIIFEWWGIYAHKMLTGTPQVSSRELLLYRKYRSHCELCWNLFLGLGDLEEHLREIHV